MSLSRHKNNRPQMPLKFTHGTKDTHGEPTDVWHIASIEYGRSTAPLHYIWFRPKIILFVVTKQFCDKKIVRERIFLKPNTFYLFHTLHCTIFGKQIIIQAKVQVKHESRRKIPTAAQHGQQGFMRADAFVGFSSGHTQTRLCTLFRTPFAFFVVLIRFWSKLQDYGLVLS